MEDKLYSKKALVIDDDVSMLSIVREILSRASINATLANSFERGLHYAENEKFDVIFLDRYTPDGDGHRVLKFLKSQPMTKDVPVIMLTGEKQVHEVQASLLLGASGYIAKPFTPKNFMDQLGKITNGQFEADKQKNIG